MTYDPSAPKGGLLSSIFCGNCCRKDTKVGELQLPNDAPIQYKKAVNSRSRDVDAAPAADKGLEDAIKIEIDTRLPPKLQDASAKPGTKADEEHSDYDYDESEEEEEEEESEEEDPNRGPPAARKEIENLRKSWEPLKKQLDINPKPKWIGTRQQNWTQQVIEEESDEDDTPDIDERKRDIENLRKSYNRVGSQLALREQKRAMDSSTPKAIASTPVGGNWETGRSAKEERHKALNHDGHRSNTSSFGYSGKKNGTSQAGTQSSAPRHAALKEAHHHQSSPDLSQDPQLSGKASSQVGSSQIGAPVNQVGSMEALRGSMNSSDIKKPKKKGCTVM